jgi:hypothetical protein
MPATDLLQLRDLRSFQPSEIATLRSDSTSERGSDELHARPAILSSLGAT